MTAMLTIDNLRTSFLQSGNKLTVIEGVSLTVEPGETVGVVGESGCGKSVTSMSIMQLLGRNVEMSGSIRFQDKELLTLSDKEMQKIRGNEIAMIFQEPMTSLNPLHPIGKQISEPLRRHLGLSKQAAKERTIELLRQVGIPRADEIISDYPHQLSGGMRQRVMIAMAMACEPKLLIADEPTTALDVTIQAQILELMKKVRNERGTSIMLITHDLGVVAEMCHRVIVMYAGQIVEEADVKKLFDDPKHPYTRGLMKSMPSVNVNQERLDAIPGAVPLLSEMPAGCRFAPRCSQVMDICREKNPELLPVSDSQKCRCWLYREGEAQ
ncbi:peptide ABC transporter ATP-binding protein [Brevibacillus choshinensis]|uniref:Peptide ABC transporter ATP-binding protein n=1 Tax=Brevibacillus choshinensis TaxID=54911 RepID=A0ABR5NAF5_BRECH|nr:ABC transporter ATP-binding protein [Brevibacillus choshinensis]KQL48498.1 peptide ABC transporter ATP-binding protein [Brevibacillus choshinensis]MED4585007.1 ABC transporter ATP-binding protein [Brevibacillus choshinensis]MED4781898.1 ABC transporter ATP-binding protein [Brevibacillus choshinensis]